MGRTRHLDPARRRRIRPHGDPWRGEGSPGWAQWTEALPVVALAVGHGGLVQQWLGGGSLGLCTGVDRGGGSLHPGAA